MKNKYQRMSKEEKKNVINEFKTSSESNTRIYKSVRRLKILCLIGMIYALICFMIGFYFNQSKIIDYVIDGILLLFCFIVYIKTDNIYIKILNKYVISKK